MNSIIIILLYCNVCVAMVCVLYVCMLMPMTYIHTWFILYVYISGIMVVGASVSF